MKAIIYARFSSDKQREQSIGDQADVCKRLAEREKFTITAIHSDDGISGSTPVQQRKGGAQLLADAMAERFDVLIVESLDRLSRDQVEQERIVRRLEHRGIIIIGVSDGYDSRMGGRKIMRGVRGLINELYLDDLRHKTHRGQSGQVDRGFVAGGKSYGYDIIKTAAGSTYQINDEQASWVRFIFAKYADGWSSQRIASHLNKIGVKSPRGSTWAVSAIYGNTKKGSGIINNALYVGRYIWNRSQWVKDPDTGKRQRFDRTESEWSVTDVPHLRIIDEDTWQAVKRRTTAPKMHGGPKVGSPSRTLFGGLMSCPHCGGAIVAINSVYYGCNTRKDRGPEVCQGIIFSREKTDKRLLNVIKQELLSNKAISQIEEQVKQIVSAKKKSSNGDSNQIQARIKELDASISRLVDAIAEVGISESIKTRLSKAEEERDNLRKDLEETMQLSIPAATMNGEIRAQIKRIAVDLQATLAEDTQAARKILAELFGQIQIKLGDDGVYAEYDNAAEKLLMAIGGVSRIVVAGAGFCYKRQKILLVKR